MRIIPRRFTEITGITDDDYRRYCQENHKNLTDRKARNEFMKQKYNLFLEKQKKEENKNDL